MASKVQVFHVQTKGDHVYCTCMRIVCKSKYTLHLEQPSALPLFTTVFSIHFNIALNGKKSRVSHQKILETSARAGKGHNTRHSNFQYYR